MASTVHGVSFVYYGSGKIPEVNSLNEARFNVACYFRGFYSCSLEAVILGLKEEESLI